MTFLELYEKTLVIVEGHKARESKPQPQTGKDETNSKGTASQAGYETAYLEYIKKNFPGTFDNMNKFKAARVLYSKLEQQSIWTAFKEHMQHICIFTELTTLSQHLDVILIQIKVSLVLQSLTDEEATINLTLPCLALTVPTTDGSPPPLAEDREGRGDFPSRAH